MKTPEELLKEANAKLAESEAKVQGLEKEVTELKAANPKTPEPPKGEGSTPEPPKGEGSTPTTSPQSHEPEFASKADFDSMKGDVAEIKESVAKLSIDIHAKDGEQSPIKGSGTDAGGGEGGGSPEAPKGEEEMTRESAESSWAKEVAAIDPNLAAK